MSIISFVFFGYATPIAARAPYGVAFHLRYSFSAYHSLGTSFKSCFLFSSLRLRRGLSRYACQLLLSPLYVLIFRLLGPRERRRLVLVRVVMIVTFHVRFFEVQEVSRLALIPWIVRDVSLSIWHLFQEVSEGVIAGEVASLERGMRMSVCKCMQFLLPVHEGR